MSTTLHENKNTVVTKHNPPVIPVSVSWLQAVTLGYWIFLVGYWIFCSKFLNLIAVPRTAVRLKFFAGYNLSCAITG
jgi:hypothetical protein